MMHSIYVGVGGWSYEPWNETFYPGGLPAKRQLEYMGRKLTAVEVNGTFYRTMPAASYARWSDETPEAFVFSLKAHRFAVTRKTREEMKEAVDWFLSSGVAALGSKLGPINWQFQNRKFEPEYFDAFMSALPPGLGDLRLRHALEVRHPSFDDPRFFDLLGRHGHTVVWADDDEYPKLRHQSADFAVARLMRSRADEASGYSEPEIDSFARTFADWSKSQDVFAFFISGAKEKNPGAAMTLLDRLGLTPDSAAQAEDLLVKRTRAPRRPAS